MTRRVGADDDDEAFDAEVFDPKYYPKRVYRDGKGPTVRLMLADAIARDANGAPPSRPAPFMTRNPRCADLTDAQLQDGLRAAAAARAKYIAELQDAWRTPIGGIGGAAHTTAPPADQPHDDDDDLSPRDRYIREISTAWQKPVGRGPRTAAANSIEALRQQWISPGARPGPGPGYGAKSHQTKDAAVADREAAYDEYIDRISNAWRAR
jgi:hypothetical protein